MSAEKLLYRFVGSDEFPFGRANEGDAGLDLCATGSVWVPAGGWGVVPAGVAVAVPEGYVGFVAPRSGLAAKFGLTVLNSPGVVDSGYRGEVKVILMNLGVEDYRVRRGDRVAQLVVVPVFSGPVVEVSELSDSERGSAGFGSSGR